MRSSILFAGVLAVAAGGAFVEAQVVPPPEVICQMECGGTFLYNFKCSRFETCCVYGSCAGEWDGGCCRNSPSWCCDRYMHNGSPVADCYECDPE